MNEVLRQEKKFLINQIQLYRLSYYFSQVMREDPHNGHDKRMKVFLHPFVCQGSKFYFSSLKLLLNIAWVLNRLKISSFSSIIFFGIDPSFLGCLNTISL